MLGREVLIPATLIAQPPDEPSKPVTPYVTTFRSTIRDVHHPKITLTNSSVAHHSTSTNWYGYTGLDQVLFFANKNENSDVFGQDPGE